MGENPGQQAPDPADRLLRTLDRNWTDLLNELRVHQTGTQILTGFLLTLPFQQKFEELDRFQVGIYLTLVGLSVLVTALLMSTIVMHRSFIHRNLKRELVELSDLLLCLTLVLVGLILAGTIGLVFDIVLSVRAGAAAALGIVLVVAALWLPVPYVLRRRALAGRRIPAPPHDGEGRAP